MELVNGLNLQEESKRRPLDMEELREGLRQLLDAVDHMHSRGITHRDIKPANVMVASRHPIYLKLTDFGLASTSHHLKTNCGTARYCAPEIRARETYTNKVDIWSLGIIALEYSYGLPRYSRKRRDEWPAMLQDFLASHGNSPTVPFLSGLLQEDPDHRFSARQGLGHIFFSSSFLTSRVDTLGQPMQGLPSLEESTDPDTGVLENVSEMARVHTDLQDTEPLDTECPSSSSNHTERLRAVQPVENLPRPGYRKRVAHVLLSTSSFSLKHATAYNIGSGDKEEVSVPYYHENPLLNPLVVGPDVAEMGREIAITTTIQQEDEASQLSEYKITTPSSKTKGKRVAMHASPVEPDHVDGVHDAQAVLGESPARLDNNYNVPALHIIDDPLTAGSNANQLEGYNAETYHIGSPRTEWPMACSPRPYEFDITIATGDFQCYDDEPPEGQTEMKDHSKRCPRDSLPELDALLPESPDHLSTRSIKFDSDDLIYVVVRRQRISMCTSDFYLNVTEICAAGGAKNKDRYRYLRKSKDRRRVHKHKSWVPFTDGVALCRTLNLV